MLPDVFFLPFPRPLSPAHAHHEEKYGWLARLGGTCRLRMHTTLRKTRSRSRIRTDGRTVVLGRVRSSKKRLASSRPTTRRTCHRSVAITVHIVPYDRDLDRAFTSVLRHVVRMRRRQVPHRQASTPRPPHVMFLTRPSTRLAIFIACYVARAGKAWERG